MVIFACFEKRDENIALLPGAGKLIFSYLQAGICSRLTCNAVDAIFRELQKAGDIYFSGRRSWQDFLVFKRTCEKTIAGNQTGLDKGEVFSKIVQDVLTIVATLENKYGKLGKPIPENKFSFFNIETHTKDTMDEFTPTKQGKKINV